MVCRNRGNKGSLKIHYSDVRPFEMVETAFKGDVQQVNEKALCV